MNTNTDQEYIYGKEHCMMMIEEGINDVGSVRLEPRSIYDEAIIGYTHQGSVVYSIGKIIGALVGDGATEEEAQEYFSYNTFGFFDSLPIIDEEKNVANPIFVNQ